MTSVRFTGLNAFSLGLFIYQPYDALVRPGRAVLDLQSAAGVAQRRRLQHQLRPGRHGADRRGRLRPAGFRRAAAARVAAGDELRAVQDPGRRPAGPRGARDALQPCYFKGAAGDLANGSVVKLLGFVVGDVHDVELKFDDRNGLPYTAVTAAIYPRKLGLATPAAHERARLTAGLADRDRCAAEPPALPGLPGAAHPVAAADRRPGDQPGCDQGRGGPARSPAAAYPVIPSEAGRQRHRRHHLPGRPDPAQGQRHPHRGHRPGRAPDHGPACAPCPPPPPSPTA